MSQPKPAVVVLLLAASLCACTAASKPLLTPIKKGAASTALYTAPLSAGRPLVLDISAPAVTSPCSGTTTTVTLSANSTTFLLFALGQRARPYVTFKRKVPIHALDRVSAPPRWEAGVRKLARALDRLFFTSTCLPTSCNPRTFRPGK
jgi:hypothetical protein